MLKLEGEILYILPNPKHSEQEQIDTLAGELDKLLDETKLYNKNIKIVGPLTGAQCIMLGFELAYMCRSVSLLTPNGFTKCFEC